MRPFEVESCFGGMTIYRYESLEGCQYSYREKESPFMLDCEHVLFHRCLREKNKARIFSNPFMSVSLFLYLSDIDYHITESSNPDCPVILIRKLWYGHAILEKVRFSDILPFLFPA